ncbi:MAG: hypothetical protein K8F55_09960 [Candidatus Methanoperedens nitroreducens]|nr:hypothetical protein [Candidatus Methanoperedens nitroreducens]
MDGDNNTIEIGELVRFEAEYGPRAGIVLQINPSKILIKGFDTNEYWLEKENLELYIDFIEGEGRARKLKTVYEEFFGVRYNRMPSTNLETLLNILQKHGISYNPDAKRADDPFRMHRNKAYLTNTERTKYSAKPILGDEISRLLPKWIEPEELPSSSRDPLGLQAFAMHLADKLLPGMTVFTSRAGYFFFLSWALKSLNETHSDTGQYDVLKRLERALVLCESLYHGKDGLKDCIHLGNRSKMRLLANGVGNVEIPDKILKRQDATGCYNLYKNSMISLGFWEEDEEAAIKGLLPYRLTKLGEKIADLFEKRNYSSELLRWAKEKETKRSVIHLENWGEDLCFLTYGSIGEKKTFLEGFLFAKGHSDRVVYDANLRLKTLIALDYEDLLIGDSINEMQAPVTDEAYGAAVSELEDKEPGYNQFFLVHYFDNRKKKNIEPFVDAAIYEILGLSLNAIFAGVFYHVKNSGRTNIPKWIAKDVVAGSRNIDFWDAKLEEAVKISRESERKLISIILSLDTSSQSGVIEAGLMLLMRVLSDEFNRQVLNSHLAECAFQDILEDLTTQKEKNMRQVLEFLIKALILHHRGVFERKHKERWLDIDGDEVYAFEISGDMALGFHSYRFPQLMSIIRDIELSREDLHNGGQ